MKKKIKIIVVIFCILLTSGCWDYKELNTLIIATSMGIDKEGDNYKVSLLIANSKKEQVSSMEGEAQTVVLTGVGKTITDAMRDIESLSPKKIYISHLSVIVLSEEVAKSDINAVNDYFLRNPASIKRFYAIIANGQKANDIIKVISPLESFPSQNIYYNIKTSSNSQAISSTIPYSDFVGITLRKGQESYLPLVSIVGKSEESANQESLKNVEPPAILKIENMALFKKEKMVAKTSHIDDTMGINLALDHVSEMNVQTSCKGGYANTILSDVSSNMKVKLINNVPKVIFSVYASGKVNEVSCAIDLRDSKNIKKIEQDAKKKVRQTILRGIKFTQNNKTDIIGIGNEFYKYYPKYFNKVQDKWNEEVFPTLNPIIDVNVHITSKGSIQNTVKEAENES